MARKVLTGLNLTNELQSNGSAGTVGQVLLSGGSNAVPTWGTFTGITASSYVVQGSLSGDQTIASATNDVLISFVDDFDPQGWWNPTTKRFQPTIAGYYNIALHAWWTAGGTTTNQYNIQIRKNANTSAIFQNQVVTGSGLSQGGSRIIYLNGSTDYVDFTAYNGDTTTRSLQWGGGGQGTWFSAALMTSGANITSNQLTLTADGGTTEGTDKFTFDGSAAKTLNIVGNTTAGIALSETSGTWTIGSNASSANGASTLVIRDASGNFSANTITASLTGTAANATNITITNDAATAVSVYPTWVTANTGNLPAKTTSAALSFVPSTGTLSATIFNGSGANLTNLNGSNVATGTVADARIASALTSKTYNGLTVTTTTGTLTITNAKTLNVNNTLTLAGTDSTTMTFPSTSATIARTDAGNTFTGSQTVRPAATQDAVIIAGRAGGTTSLGVTITPTTLTASRTATLPDFTGNIAVISGTLAVDVGKTLTVSRTLTLTGTDSTTMTFPSTSATIARTDAAQTFTGAQTLTPAAAVAATAASTAGYIGMPQNSQSGAYTLVAADAGKHIYYTVTGQTVTIPANSSVAYEIGTTITFITAPSVSLSIAITTDTLRLANTATTGTRTLAANGIATAIKTTATTWVISGNGLS
jgi:hypothetical protein